MGIFLISGQHASYVAQTSHIDLRSFFPKQHDNQLLGDAAARADHQEVARLLNVQADIEVRGIGGHTPLMQAIIHASSHFYHYNPDANPIATIQVLLANGANPNAQTFFKITPLLQAIAIGKEKLAIPIVQLILNSETFTTLNTQTLLGTTALMRAAEKNYSVIFAMLIEAGADIDLKRKPRAWLYGNTALEIAQIRNHKKILRIIRRLQFYKRELQVFIPKDFTHIIIGYLGLSVSTKIKMKTAVDSGYFSCCAIT